MINLPLFIDLYRGDPVIDFNATKQSGIVGVYHKSSEGNTWTDNTYDGRRKLWMNGTSARLNGGQSVPVVWGAYHFFHGGSPRTEAAHFIAAANPDSQTLMVCDWEEVPGGVAASAAAARAFIEEVEAHTSRLCAIYSGNAAKEKIHGHDAFFGARPLILAQYGTRWAVQESWSRPWGWQNNGDTFGPGPHSIPGIRGNCDNNTILTDPGQAWPDAVRAFLQTWKGQAAPGVDAPPVPPPPPPVAPPEDSFTVVASEFGGRGDRQKSAYSPFGLVDPEKLGCALPYHFPAPLPLIDVTYQGKVVTVEVVDVGPGNTNDPYWRTGTKPRYHAGIDLTPAVWDHLGVSRLDPIRGMVTMSWAFHPSVVAAGRADNYVV